MPVPGRSWRSICGANDRLPTVIPFRLRVGAARGRAGPGFLRVSPGRPPRASFPAMKVPWLFWVAFFVAVGIAFVAGAQPPW